MKEMKEIKKDILEPLSEKEKNEFLNCFTNYNIYIKEEGDFKEEYYIVSQKSNSIDVIYI